MKHLKPLAADTSIPVLGLGTWKLNGTECTEVVRESLEIGYRHIDTAIMYENQREIGKAIKGTDRESLFITSKVPHTELRKTDFRNSAESILKELQVDYLDLLLIHWPNKSVDLRESLTALAELKEEKKIRAAGVSNFTEGHLKEALAHDIVDITNNQVECHPHFQQHELFQFCESKGITMTAYSPLGRGEVLDDETLEEIATEVGKPVAAVSLRWLLQRGLIAVPKASSKGHLRENFETLSWALTEEQMERISKIGVSERLIDPEWSEFDRESTSPA